MKKLLVLSVIGAVILQTAPAFADHSGYKSTPEYQKIQSNMRSNLQNCLNNTQMSAKDCIKSSKKTYKHQKQELKKNYKKSSAN